MCCWFNCIAGSLAHSLLVQYVNYMCCCFYLCLLVQLQPSMGFFNVYMLSLFVEQELAAKESNIPTPSEHDGDDDDDDEEEEEEDEREVL